MFIKNIVTMTQKETTVLKGVAILMMLFLHLFNSDTKIGLCRTYIEIADISLLKLFVRVSNPVAFYIILSGYGLYMSYLKGKKKQGKRILKLYIHYWITLTIFVTAGYFLVGGATYPGSWQKAVENITGWDTSYNGEIWFLFPYCLVAITSPFIFKLTDRVNPWIVLGSVGVIYLAAYVSISIYGVAYLYSHRLSYMPVLYFEFLFPFVIGALMAKYDIINKFKIGGGTALCLLLLLVAVRMCISVGVFHPLYAAVFIILFVKIKRWKWLDNFLCEMGKRSTSMWFVHTWFCVYLFRDFIYCVHYPFLIFLVLIVISYITAIVIDWVYARALALLHLN